MTTEGMTTTEAVQVLKEWGYGVAWVIMSRQWHVYIDYPPSDRVAEYLSDQELIAKAEEINASQTLL